MSPLILSFPVMKSRWALPLPETRLPKSSSERERVTALVLAGHSCARNAPSPIRAPGLVSAWLTCRLVSKSLADLALVLEVDVPAVGLAGLVLEVEGEDGLSLLDGIRPVGVAGVQGLVDEIEGSRGRESVCGRKVRLVARTKQIDRTSAARGKQRGELTVLERHLGGIGICDL